MLLRGRWIVAVAMLAVAGCVDDPPDPDAADTTTTPAATSDSAAVVTTAPVIEDAGDEFEAPDAVDDTLDRLEEQFENQGVKDIRAEAGGQVTIRMDDEMTVAAVGPVCAAVRAAGFGDVIVDIDDVITPCP
jgi:hypothetical protein